MSNITDVAAAHTPQTDLPVVKGQAPVADVLNRIPVQTTSARRTDDIAAEMMNDELRMGRRSNLMQIAVIGVVTILLACGFWVVFGGLLANTLGR